METSTFFGALVSPGKGTKTKMRRPSIELRPLSASSSMIDCPSFLQPQRSPTPRTPNSGNNTRKRVSTLSPAARMEIFSGRPPITASPLCLPQNDCVKVSAGDNKSRLKKDAKERITIRSKFTHRIGQSSESPTKRGSRKPDDKSSSPKKRTLRSIGKGGGKDSHSPTRVEASDHGSNEPPNPLALPPPLVDTDSCDPKSEGGAVPANTKAGTRTSSSTKAAASASGVKRRSQARRGRTSRLGASRQGFNDSFDALDIGDPTVAAASKSQLGDETGDTAHSTIKDAASSSEQLDRKKKRSDKLNKSKSSRSGNKGEREKLARDRVRTKRESKSPGRTTTKSDTSLSQQPNKEEKLSTPTDNESDVVKKKDERRAIREERAAKRMGRSPKSPKQHRRSSTGGVRTRRLSAVGAGNASGDLTAAAAAVVPKSSARSTEKQHRRSSLGASRRRRMSAVGSAVTSTEFATRSPRRAETKRRVFAASASHLPW